ncbi:MAG TPA: rhomboid family intramembrane serine protease, partial [Propylenella sp.]|nr:rhomboid family intramembrane serine protease [Propylenella sp.]
MTDILHDPWIEIGRFAHRADVNGYALALNAIGIRCRLMERDDGIALFVAAADAGRARRELVEYDRENPRLPAPAASSPFEGLNAALAYCALLIFTFVASDRQILGLDWWSAGSANAGLILSGEWWRTITALGLHADLGHLAGNIFAGAIFGVLLTQSIGSGLAWLSILLAGAGGNWLNALIQPAGHTAVGASTGVFAALGLLSAMTWRRQASRWARGLRR